MAHDDLHNSMPGQLLARGVARLLASHGLVCIEELVPTRGLRVDVMALGPRGELWIVECKSSRADFTSDCKWEGYLDWGDRFFWAVDTDFPTEILPPETGLILADGFGAEVVRMPEATPLAAPVDVWLKVNSGMNRAGFVGDAGFRLAGWLGESAAWRRELDGYRRVRVGPRFEVWRRRR